MPTFLSGPLPESPRSLRVTFKESAVIHRQNQSPRCEGRRLRFPYVRLLLGGGGRGVPEFLFLFPLLPTLPIQNPCGGSASPLLSPSLRQSRLLDNSSGLVPAALLPARFLSSHLEFHFPKVLGAAVPTVNSAPPSDPLPCVIPLGTCPQHFSTADTGQQSQSLPSGSCHWLAYTSRQRKVVACV